MSVFISKLQYRNCEPGEYFSIAVRSLEETIQLIKDYPFEIQRQQASVYMTCPSVCIEHPSGSFLKIGPYYNGKFCLYLLDATGVLSTRIINSLDESLPVVTDFFKDVYIGHEFKAVAYTFFPKKHFATNRYEYTVTPERIFRYLLLPEIPFGIFFLWILIKSSIGNYGFGNKIFALGAGMFLAGFNYYLFFNYYFFSKKLYLRISKGHDRFLFGTKINFREYRKDEIDNIRIYRNKGHRCPWGMDCVIEIYFKNGEFIQFPNLLINEIVLQEKLPGVKVNEVHEFLATCLKSKLADE